MKGYFYTFLFVFYLLLGGGVWDWSILSLASENPVQDCKREFILTKEDKRSYLLCSPKVSRPSYPLLIALHGGLGNAERFAKTSQLHKLFPEFIVVYPEGTSLKRNNQLRVWNAGSCCGMASIEYVDDVGFISSLIDRISRKFPVDGVFVIGFSNGGMMAYRLVCEIPERLRGVTVVSGTLVYGECDFERAKNVAILHIHGLKDHFIPFRGGTGKFTGVRYPGVLKVLHSFAKPRKCRILSESSEIAIDVEYKCLLGVPIKLHLLKTIGHEWPDDPIVLYFFRSLMKG